MLKSLRALGPTEHLLLRRVFEEAMDCLPIQKRTSAARQAVAERILDCAATGERDPVELRIAAIRGFD
jgi:hypothetical protein